MALPTQPVTLSPQQVSELNHRLSTLRHDINNNLLLIMASAELIRYKPETLTQMTNNLIEQPPKITDAMNKFSIEFERLLGISRL
jgi:hypothetical protein